MDISIAGLKLTQIKLLIKLPILSWAGGDSRVGTKIHNYTRHVEGCHYFLSSGEVEGEIYLTADDASVKSQDYIVLQDKIRYQVESLEHYSDSPTLWTARLVRCF